jgi:hypothetical protein
MLNTLILPVNISEVLEPTAATSLASQIRCASVVRAAATANPPIATSKTINLPSPNDIINVIFSARTILGQDERLFGAFGKIGVSGFSF